MKADFKLLFFLFLFASNVVNGQKLIGPISSNQKKGFETITSAINFLKQKSTANLSNLKTFTGTETLIYQELFSKYFDTSYLRDTIAINNSLSFQQRLGLLFTFLYNIDHYLDVIPLDSIYFSSAYFLDSTAMSLNSSNASDEIIAYFLIQGKQFWVYQFSFSNDGKIALMTPCIDFEGRNNEIDVEAFYRRQKGYSSIEPKLWHFTGISPGH